MLNFEPQKLKIRFIYICSCYKIKAKYKIAHVINIFSGGRKNEDNLKTNDCHICNYISNCFGTCFEL